MNLFEAFEYIRENPEKVLVNKHNGGEVMRQRGAHVTVQNFHCLTEKFYGGVPIYINNRTLDSEWIDSGTDLDQITKELIAIYC